MKSTHGLCIRPAEADLVGVVASVEVGEDADVGLPRHLAVLLHLLSSNLGIHRSIILNGSCMPQQPLQQQQCSTAKHRRETYMCRPALLLLNGSCTPQQPLQKQQCSRVQQSMCKECTYVTPRHYCLVDPAYRCNHCRSSSAAEQSIHKSESDVYKGCTCVILQHCGCWVLHAIAGIQQA